MGNTIRKFCQDSNCFQSSKNKRIELKDNSINIIDLTNKYYDDYDSRILQDIDSNNCSIIHKIERIYNTLTLTKQNIENEIKNIIENLHQNIDISLNSHQLLLEKLQQHIDKLENNLVDIETKIKNTDSEINIELKNCLEQINTTKKELNLLLVENCNSINTITNKNIQNDTTIKNLNSKIDKMDNTITSFMSTNWNLVDDEEIINENEKSQMENNEENE